METTQTIDTLFARDLSRGIEEVIKVDQRHEAAVRQELIDYVVTDAIKEHFITLYRAIADSKSEPHEGIGIWVSGFFGSGKSYFAKILGYTVADRELGETSASQLFKENARDEKLSNYLDVINGQIPTHAVIFDVSMDRGVRTANERITEIMYKALLRELDYSEDFDLAELEISLEEDGELESFVERFEEFHSQPWRKRRKLGQAINEASAVLHQMKRKTYSSPDSWATSLGQGRADITPNQLARRSFELANRRKPGHTLIFVIDEVGQYVSRSVEKMLDLQGVVQAFGVEGKNRVLAGEAVAPCWICVTSQEKLNEVVDAIDSRKIELARLQDRFPITIDLKQSDIAEVTGRRVLDKTEEAEQILGRLYDENEGRLKTFCTLEGTSRRTSLERSEFIRLYPYLPYQIDLSIDIVSGLRLKRGAQRHIGGSNRTLIKQAQQMLRNPRTSLGSKPIGRLVTLDLVYELLYLGNLLPTETTQQVDEITKRFPEQEMAARTARAIALLEVITDLPRTVSNLAAVLHPAIDAESQEEEVRRALDKLIQGQLVREAEDGFKLLSVQEKGWEQERAGAYPKPAERNQILRELVRDIFGDSQVRNFRYQGQKTFQYEVSVDGVTVQTGGTIPLNIWLAEDDQDLVEKTRELRQLSNDRRDEIFWTSRLSEEIRLQIVELHRSREMVNRHMRDASQGKLKGELSSLYNAEKVRLDRTTRDIRQKLATSLAYGSAFFRGVEQDISGKNIAEALHDYSNRVIPELYPKLELGTRRLKGTEIEKFLDAANLDGLPLIFYSGQEGLDLVIRQDGKHVPNLSAEICREILEYLRREHAYGNRVTGKILERHFEGIGYGWDREVVRLVVAVLLRGGAIEVTHQGNKYRHHGEPAVREVFTQLNPFRAAAFAPREALGLKTLADAARAYEQLTGREVDIEESAIATAFQELAQEDRERVLPLLARMRAHRLPGHQSIQDFLETVEGIRSMPPDDCVKTLAGDWKSYQESRDRVLRLEEVLTDKALEDLEQARTVLQRQWPVLAEREEDEELASRAEEVKSILNSEEFYQEMEGLRLAVGQISRRFATLYSELHVKRLELYGSAVDDIKGLSQWTAAEAASPEEAGRILATLEQKACQKDLAFDSQEMACRLCYSSVGQIESDIEAVDGLKARVLRRLAELAEPKRKIQTVRVSEIVTGVIQSEEDVKAVVEELSNRLQKLIAEGIDVILE